MDEDIQSQIEALKSLPMKELVQKYEALFGIKVGQPNKIYFLRRIAYRMQESASGKVSPEIKNGIESLIQIGRASCRERV